jgi:hypothetical protein
LFFLVQIVVFAFRHKHRNRVTAAHIFYRQNFTDWVERGQAGNKGCRAGHCRDGKISGDLLILISNEDAARNASAYFLRNLNIGNMGAKNGSHMAEL